MSRAAPTITGEGPPDPQPALGFDHLSGLPRRGAFNELIVGERAINAGALMPDFEFTNPEGRHSPLDGDGGEDGRRVACHEDY
jgi:hypothetical protein